METPNKIPMDILVADALAVGYEVIVLILDDDEDAYWCANSQTYIPKNIDPNHGYDLDFIALMEEEMRLEDEAWQKAMEKEHGGKITPECEIDLEEHNRRVLEESPEHDTWYDPSKPFDVVDADSACYCGWLGIDSPPKEFAPPGCDCYVEGSE